MSRAGRVAAAILLPAAIGYATMCITKLSGALDDPSENTQEALATYNILCYFAREMCENSFTTNVAGFIATVSLTTGGLALLGEGARTAFQCLRGQRNPDPNNYGALDDQPPVDGNNHQGQYPNGVTPSAPIVGAENPNGLNKQPDDNVSSQPSSPSQTAQLQKNIGSPLHSSREKTPQDPDVENALDNRHSSSRSPSPSQ